MNEKKTAPQTEYKAQSQLKMVMGRMRKNKTAMFGLVIFVLLVLVAIFGPILAPHDPNIIDFSQKLETPSLEHPFGCDELGRDMFSRMIIGTRYSLLLGFGAVIISTVLGVILGSICGYFGGKLDTVIMRVLDVFQSIPGMLMGIVVSTALGTGLVNTMIALSIPNFPAYTRQLRASVMSIRSAEYLESAESINCSKARIILRHILPNAFSPLLVVATLGVAHTISMAAGLSFVGLGVQPPTPEWGAILSASRQFMRDYPHMIIFPGLIIGVSVLCLNLMGDGLRDALDPKLRK